MSARGHFLNWITLMETNFVKVRQTYKNKGEINNDQRFKHPNDLQT